MSNRIIYPVQAVFVGPSPATGVQASGSLLQVLRTQTVSHDWSVQRESIYELGQYGAIARAIVKPPTVSSEIGWISTSAINESGLGLYIGGDVSALKYLMDGTQLTKNYFIRVVPEGQSAAGYTGIDGSVVGLGNCSISSYKAQGGLGQLPKVSVGLQGLNLNYSNHSDNIDSPAVNPHNGLPIGLTATVPQAGTGLNGQIAALLPGATQVSIGSSAFGLQSFAVQTYEVGFDLNLEPLQDLNDRYPYTYVPQFPVNCSVTVEVLARDFATGNLANFICQDPIYTLLFQINTPTCDGTTGANKINYILKNAKLDGESSQTSIGPNKTVTLKYTAPIGGPQEISSGLFISGSLS